jgi:dihydrolipoamide dehydrogenase
MSTSSTEERRVDVAVIGAGTAGLAAYRAASAVTPNVVLIEGGEHGTTCARVGCMPSKLLIAAAEVAYEGRHAARFGLRATMEIDGRAVLERVRRERDRFVGFVVEAVEKIDEVHRLTAYARFLEPGLLDLGRHRLRAGAVVIATGSSPFVPPMFNEVRDRADVNDDLFAWETLPESVAVFGAGIIGLELGQALCRLGVRVRVFGKGNRLGALSDPVVRDAAFAAIRAELPIELDAKVKSVRPGESAVAVEWDDSEGQGHVESFERVLVAAGRRPNLNNLDIERGGVALDPRGLVAVDPTTMQAGRSNVFLAGDVNHVNPLLHEAADEGKIAGDNAARFPEVRMGQRRSSLAIVFSDPQMAVAGEAYSRLEGRGAAFVSGAIDFGDQGRSRVMLKNRGAARVYADPATGRFLGAEVAGPSAEHIGHLLAWAHQQRMTIDQMLAMPFYHPVVEEGIRTALRDVNAKLAASR